MKRKDLEYDLPLINSVYNIEFPVEYFYPVFAQMIANILSMMNF